MAIWLLLQLLKKALCYICAILSPHIPPRENFFIGFWHIRYFIFRGQLRQRFDRTAQLTVADMNIDHRGPQVRMSKENSDGKRVCARGCQHRAELVAEVVKHKI